MKLTTIALLGLGAAAIVVGWHDLFGDGNGNFRPWIPGLSSPAIPAVIAMGGAALIASTASR